MSESRRPPPPTIVDRQRPAAQHTNPDGYRLSNAHKPTPQEPIPGYQDFFARRFELARWLLDRHTHLAAGRSNSALLLVLIDILTVALSILLYAAVNTGFAFFLRVILLVLQSLIWGCLLVAIIFALMAAIWRRSSSNEGSEADIFFMSGDSLANTSGLLQDQSEYSQQFRERPQDDLFNGAVHVLYASAKARKVQEQRISISIFATLLAFLGLGLVAIAALSGVL